VSPKPEAVVTEADLFRHLCPGGRALVLPSHKRKWEAGPVGSRKL